MKTIQWTGHLRIFEVYLLMASLSRCITNVLATVTSAVMVSIKLLFLVRWESFTWNLYARNTVLVGNENMLTMD